MTRRPGRGWWFWAGVTLVTCGLLLIGYVGWQLNGTTVIAHRQQDRVVGATERVWAAGASAGTTDEDRDLADDVVALVRIPAFGDDYAVPAYAGTDDDTLERGFGIFDASPEPGGVGNFALSGHRITHGEPLRDMPDLKAGDTVVVETRDRIFTYVLDTGGDSLTVDTGEDWVADPLPVDPDGRDVGLADSPRLLTLVTCSELFHTDGRLVAFGHLVTAEPRPRPRA